MWSEVDRECGGLRAGWSRGIVGWPGSRETHFNPREVTSSSGTNFKVNQGSMLFRQRKQILHGTEAV